jgi:hypothetical protein
MNDLKLKEREEAASSLIDSCYEMVRQTIMYLTLLLLIGKNRNIITLENHKHFFLFGRELV